MSLGNEVAPLEPEGDVGQGKLHAKIADFDASMGIFKEEKAPI